MMTGKWGRLWSRRAHRGASEDAGNGEEPAHGQTEEKGRASWKEHGADTPAGDDGRWAEAEPEGTPSDGTATGAAKGRTATGMEPEEGSRRAGGGGERMGAAHGELLW
jgi:hypothetical protein